MGAWGTDIFEDDFACDVRDEYIKEIIHGKTNEEATANVMKKLLPKQNDEDYSVFWIALALTQWQKGRLLPDVKKTTLSVLESDEDLTRWKELPEKTLSKRTEALHEAYIMLQNPMPKARKISVPSWMKSDPWKVGDLLSYKLNCSNIEHTEYYNKYIMLRVVQMQTDEQNGNEFAYYAVYSWYGNAIPTPEQMDKIPYLKMAEYNKGTENYRYTISKHFPMTLRDHKEHNVKVITHDPTFRIQNNDLLRLGEQHRSLEPPRRFELEIVKSLQQLKHADQR